MKRVVITGATGFVGKPLTRKLIEQGYSPTVLTRDPARAAESLPASCELVSWDGKSSLSPDLIRGAAAVIHLAGESVAGRRWNEAVKKEIRASRVESTRRLAEAIDRAQEKPVLIGASGIGYYGDRGNELLTEESTASQDFLAGVCVDWEHAYACSAARTVILRTGLVWGHGGALEKMLPPFRLGLGGKLGSGRQWVSWIHLDDLVGMYLFALENKRAEGPWNAVAPNPVTNAELTRTLGKILHRPTFASVPEIALRLAVGEMAEALLGSQRVSPSEPHKLGFRYRFPTLHEALVNLLR